MLIIKAPLELKCDPGIISSKEAFGRRIAGNYGVVSCGISREDLFHVVTAPPEIYLEEGRVIQIVNDTTIRNSRENRLEIINNFLNRILVQEDVELTYQDRIYITNILNRLGIRDVKQFMKQVSRIKEETRTAERLISLYWNHLGELTKMVKEYHSRNREKETVREEERERVQVTLHETIMNRLKTGAVYQILNNFQTDHSRSSFTVSSQELQMTEQKRVALHVLLHQLRNEVRGESMPLVYRHENYYEQMRPEGREALEEQVLNQITSAVLLNLVDQLYLSRFEKLQQRKDIWLSLEQSLYQTAENTLYRLKTGVFPQIGIQKEQNLWMVRQQQYQKQEIQMVRLLLTEGEKSEMLYSSFQARYGAEIQKILEKQQEQAEIRFAEKETSEESGAIPGTAQRGEAEKSAAQKSKPSARESGRQETERIPDETGTGDRVKRTDRQKIQPEVWEQIKRETVTESWPRPVEAEREQEAKLQTVSLKYHAEQQEAVPEEQIEEYLQWMKEEQNRFYHMVEQYLRVSGAAVPEAEHSFWENRILHERERLLEYDRLRKEPAAFHNRRKGADAVDMVLPGQPESKPGPEPAGKEERTLDGREVSAAEKKSRSSDIIQKLQKHTEKYAAEYRTDTFKAENEKRIVQRNTERYGMQGDIPEERQHSGEEEYELRQQLRKINEQNLVNVRLYQQMLEQQKKAQKPVAPAERDMRQDSLKALQDPESLLKEYKEEKEEEEQQRIRQTERLLALLPQHTRSIYERLEQYERENGASSALNRGITRNNIGLLLHDIRQAETESQNKESIRTEEIRRVKEISRTELEKWKKEPAEETFIRKGFADRREEPVSLIHKSTDRQIDQEILESLLEQNRVTKEKTVLTEQEFEEHKTVQKTVHQQTQQVRREEMEDITDLIQRGVLRQMGAISEQIYSRLEKRLQNEKKRRGY